MDRVAEVRLAHDDIELFALTWGSGPPLLFFHGGLADHRAALLHAGSWTGLRVITPDLRGAGRSRAAGRLGWATWASDAVALLDHLGVDRAVVGGVSMGSGVALRVALDHPARVAGTLLMHPVFGGSDRGLEPEAADALRRIGDLAPRLDEEGLDALRPLYGALPDQLRARALAMLDDFDAPSVAATARFLGSLVQPFDHIEQLAAIRGPSLVIPGVDPSHPAAVAHDLASALPDARLADAPSPEEVERFVRDATAR